MLGFGLDALQTSPLFFLSEKGVHIDLCRHFCCPSGHHHWQLGWFVLAVFFKCKRKLLNRDKMPSVDAAPFQSGAASVCSLASDVVT